MSLVTVQRSPGSNSADDLAAIETPDVAIPHGVVGLKALIAVSSNSPCRDRDLKQLPSQQQQTTSFFVTSNCGENDEVPQQQQQYVDDNKEQQVVEVSSPPLTDKLAAKTSEIHLSKTNEKEQFCPRTSSLYFVVKDAALILPRRSSGGGASGSLWPKFVSDTAPTPSLSTNDSVASTTTTAATLSSGVAAGDILIHLQSMFTLLRPNDTISVAVKLTSYATDRCRYLVIVETQQTASGGEESAILGVDLVLPSPTNSPTTAAAPSNGPPVPPPLCTIGLVLPIYANCTISLNGDGGFKFQSHHAVHIFKPVSIQAMWSAYQYLHKAFENARKSNYYESPSADKDISACCPCSCEVASAPCDLTATGCCAVCCSHPEQFHNHEWVKYYSRLTKSPLTIVNEWYQKEERSAQREDFTTPYYDGASTLSKEQELIGMRIREKLKEIMISSKDDYGSMSSIHIRRLLERELELNLDNFKKFIDITIFQFYNQLVECASPILQYLQLGTEWNASNYDILVSDRITHILNVSSDVDNFFPDAVFKYLNIRVQDVEETDLLKEFDRANRFIAEAKEQGTCCLVHCKMGVSRSASIVIAYLMKEFNWSFEQAFAHTKQKRSCINPNKGFREQLLTYESILTAHRAKYHLFDPTLAVLTEAVVAEDFTPPQIGPSVREVVNKIKSMGNASPEPLPHRHSTSPPQSPIAIKQQQSSSQLVTSSGPRYSTVLSSSSYSSLMATTQTSTLYSSTPSLPNSQSSSVPSLIMHKSSLSCTLRTSPTSPLGTGHHIKRTTSHLSTQNRPIISVSPQPKDLSMPAAYRNTIGYAPCTVTRTSHQSKVDSTNSDRLKCHIGTHHQRSKSNVDSMGHPASTTPTLTNSQGVMSSSVRRLAEDYLNKTDAPSTPTSDLVFQIPVDCSASNLSLPIGTVKRQVASINFTSKPLELDPNSNETEQKSGMVSPPPQHSDITQCTGNVVGNITTPDSKRFKCESNEMLSEPISQSVGLVRMNETNRSSNNLKVFEFLAEKKRKQKEADEELERERNRAASDKVDKVTTIMRRPTSMATVGVVPMMPQIQLNDVNLNVGAARRPHSEMSAYSLGVLISKTS